MWLFGSPHRVGATTIGMTCCAAWGTGRGASRRYVNRFDSSCDRWPGPARLAGWRTWLPPGFAVWVKGTKGLIHGKKLRAPGWSGSLKR